MSSPIKNQRNILNKLSIEKLNPMQEEALLAIHSHKDIVLLSPTGTGKTLAFLLPLISELCMDCDEVQALIIVPSRELAIQIEQVIRNMGTGYKTNAIYGGRSGYKDKIDLKHRPAILIGTPGRIADHLRRKTFPADKITTLVLDEFDKSLEIGFEEEMKTICDLLPDIKKRILTSASNEVEIPTFVGLKNPFIINYLDDGVPQLKIKTIISPSKDKLVTLLETIVKIGNQPGIIFCNFKDTIQWVSNFLTENNIEHGCFYGDMEQKDRERTLIKFRNGTYQLIIATDLASRGLDIPELKFIIHYQLPNRGHEFIHRNGRTARMNSKGTAFVLKWINEELPDFIKDSEHDDDNDDVTLNNSEPNQKIWKTLYISGGRNDKISKGDIAGLFMKQGKLNKDEIGTIEIKQECAFVAIDASKVNRLINILDNTKLKNKKIKVSII